MTDEAERIRRVPFPGAPSGTPARRAPRPTGTLEEILAGIEATTPAERLVDDLTRIERALSRVERVLGLPGDGHPR
jgi:hypothetical protein